MAVALVAGLLIGAAATYALEGQSPGRPTTVTATAMTTVTSTLTNANTSISGSTITYSTTTLGNETIASTTDTTLGLELMLTLNATHITAGQTIGGNVSWRNVLPTVLNLSSQTEDWQLTALADQGDDYGYCVGEEAFAPVIYEGYFLASNITLGAPLGDLKNALTYCALHPPSFYVFQPLASGRGFTIATYGYNINNQLVVFLPGTYTVVAGDRWGQMVILHFEVTKANP